MVFGKKDVYLHQIFKKLLTMTMKRHLITLAMLCITAVMLAVPAKRGQWRTITLTDGSQVRVELMGDEFVKFYQAEDGRVFHQIKNTQRYEQISRTEITKIALERRMAEKQNNGGMYASGPAGVTLGGDHQPYEGTKKCLCVLVEFTDMQFEEGHDIDLYNNLVNGIDYVDEALGHVGSVRDYFRSQSYGKFDIDFDVVGPYQVSHDYAYYGAHSEWSNDIRPDVMVKEAIELANPDVNFAEYDWDGDGYVEPIFFLYAGKGEADGGDENTIWPHKSSIQSVKRDGVKIRDYACGSELNGRGGIDGIGTMCHEYSHCLGLPDMYDTAYGSNDTPGYWDIMDSGCYNGMGGDIPAGYTAYERWYAGWLEPVELDDNYMIYDMPALSTTPDAYVVYNDAYRKEYFLLENRVRTGWDAALPNGGLIISHVDFDSGIWSWNMVNTTDYGYNDHARYTIVHAGNNKNNDATDAYPYNGNNQFTDFSTPASQLFHNNTNGKKYLSKPIMGIKKADDETISFEFSTSNPEIIVPEGALFYEGFLYCTGEGGNDDNFKPTAKGSFVPDNEGWISDYAYGGAGCALFGNSSKRGNATTPKFNLSGSDSYILTFLAAPFGTETKNVALSVASGEASLSETTAQLTAGEWTDYTVTIQGDAEISVNFQSNSRRFFLDEVLVMPSDPTGIQEVKPTAVSNKIYNLAGQQVTAGTKGITISGGRKYFTK